MDERERIEIEKGVYCQTYFERGENKVSLVILVWIQPRQKDLLMSILAYCYDNFFCTAIVTLVIQLAIL